MLVFAAQIVSILSVLLLGLGYLKANPKAMSARLCFLLSICIVAYLLISMSLAHIDHAYRLETGNWGPLLFLASNAIPGVFMLYCYYIFEDEGAPSRSLIALFFAGLTLSQARLQLPELVSSLAQIIGELPVELIVDTLPNLLQLFFAGLAMYWVARGWSHDLVESRRVWRLVVLSTQAVTILVVLVVENYVLLIAQEHYVDLRIAIHYSIALISFCALSLLFRFDYAPLERVLDEGVTEEPVELDGTDVSAAVALLEALLKEKKVYREHGLTIAKLADKMDLPEYRLRALINRHLGYRNFSALLHEYRIEDACEMLRDKQEKPLPVLTIALTVGYQSITPFNKAFRQLKGVTPTAYRRSEID